MLINSFNKALKRYDKELFCGINNQGIPCVFRRKKRFVKVLDDSEMSLYSLVNDRDYVMALTEDWSPRTKVRQWGIDNVLNRLRDIDLAHNARLIEELDENNEQIDNKQRRHLKSEAEAFFSDTRGIIKKQFSDINTSTLNKNNDKQRLRDRRIKNGNY